MENFKTIRGQNVVPVAAYERRFRMKVWLLNQATDFKIPRRRRQTRTPNKE